MADRFPDSKSATILTVVGARPQFVKAAVVSEALKEQRGVREVLVHTGQHYDASLSDVFFDELGMSQPDFNLEVGSGSHGFQTGTMLIRLEEVCQKIKPDMVLVYGDTNSTLSAALVAAKLNIPLAHVEAGLRSFDTSMPEEINRIVTDRLSKILFAPTDAAVQNLQNEGIDHRRIVRAGDVMIDAAARFKDAAASRSTILARLGIQNVPYALATIHRASNVDDEARLANIAGALSQLSRTLPVVFPVHPRTRAKLRGELGPNVKLIEPVGFLDMRQLEANAKLIATDSGGVQKEAFFHKVPCVTFRHETEWVELVAGGFNRLAPPTASRPMLDACLAALRSSPDFEGAADLYGKGAAAQTIAAHLVNWLSNQQR